MSQQQRFQAPPRKKNALDEYKLRLSGKPQQGATKPPSLAFSVVKNMPHIDVYTNVPNDKDNGRIKANMDAPTFFALLQLLDQAINSEGPVKFKIENKNFVWPKGERSKEPVTISTTVVGKGSDGRVFISVVAYDKSRPIIPFYFGPSSYHNIIDGEGNPMAEGEVSKAYARGYLRLLYNLVPSVLTAEYVEPEPRQQNGGGNGGGNYRGGNGGGGGGYNGGNGGGNKWGGDSAPKESGGAADSWDDDFPM